MADQNPSNANLPNQPQSVRDQVALITYVEDLIKEKKDDPIKPEALPQVKAALLNEVNQMINTRMVAVLSDTDQQELDILLKNKATNEELDNFFKNKIPNLQAELASVLLDFRAAYLYKPETKTPEAPPPAPVPPKTV